MTILHLNLLLAATRAHGPFGLPPALVPLAFLVLASLLLRLTPYVLAPIALYRMSPQHLNPKLRLVAANELLDPEVRAYIEASEQALARAGFIAPERITTQTELQLTGVETLLENPDAGDLANVVALLNKAANAPERLITCVTFRSALADGTTVITSNTTAVGYWPVEPTKCTVNLPDVRDPITMYRLHRARMAQLSASAAQEKLTRGATPEQRLAFATRQWLDSTNYLIKVGYRKRSPSGIRNTALGATFTAWRRMFPWKQLLEQQRRRATAEVMRLA